MPKHLRCIRIVVFLGLLFSGITTPAQTEKEYESISIAEGLSQGMVFDLLQDAEGFMWVATKNGLNRYDGYGFKVFTNDPYNANSLSSNTVVKLFEDSKGRIWAGTENAGLNIYDKKSGKFYRIVHSKDNPASLSGNGIRAVMEMPDGRIIVATTDATEMNIVALSNGFFTRNEAPVITRLSLPNAARVYGMGKDKNGVIWIGGMDGLVYRFDPQKNEFLKLSNGSLLNDGYQNRDSSKLITDNFYLSDGKEIFPLFNTSKITPGNIIFKLRQEPWEYHHREEYFYDVYKYEPGKPVNWSEPLPKTTIRMNYPFIIDRSGILWSGSVGWGLRKYNTASSKFQTRVSGKTIRLIIPLNEKEAFIVSYDYNWWSLKEDGQITAAFKKDPALNQVDNLIIASTGDYWFKCDEHGYFKYSPSSNILQPRPGINAGQAFGKKQPFIEDSRGYIWFPGVDGNITLLNIKSEKTDSFTINKDASKITCTALYEDKQGTFWVGTEKGFAKVMLNHNNPASSQVQWFYNNNNDRNSLNYNHVSCFLDDPANPQRYLWISTKGGGLNRLDKTNGNFFHLTKKDGLPDDVVYGLLTDTNNNIWGSTNKGIFCMLAAKTASPNQYRFRNFTKSAGLQDDEFNTGAFAKLPDGRLAFGGVNGITVFNPAEILAQGFTPGIFITNILVGNQPVLPNDKSGVLNQTIEQTASITLNHLQDILTLEFSSLDFTSPAQNKYRYQLVGIDEDWVESGTRRTATYLHLPAGNYTFKVQGSNSQGVWSNKITELKIRVLPPWWLSWWAYVLYTVLAVIAVRSYFIFRINKARLQSELVFEQQEAKRVKELDTVKTHLYANITHEFRTPLTVIIGMASQIKSDPKTNLDTGVDMIIRNGENLLNLVNEMLDLSKLESGKMTLHLVNGDIISYLRYIVESFQSLAASQKKQFHFLADTDELLVAYDAEKIRQIITNLFSNALKFTPELGNIYVSISQEAGTNRDSTVLILKVKDTGIGIPENQLPHIFDRFYQLDNSHTRKAEGTGIGLALTKELVKLMNGVITVKSPPVGATKGTEFIITIPLAKTVSVDSMIPGASTRSDITPAVQVNEKPREDQVHRMDTNNSNPLVLLVEDNADVVAYTASCLPDYKLAVGKDGREGFDIAAEIIPDLIITDVMMPFIDGFEMCRMLRRDERTSHIPIIMLTAKADMQSKLEGLEKGADVYLEKPFHKDELLLRIRKLLELRKNLQEYYSRQMGITDAAGTPAKEEGLAEEPIEHEFVKKVREIVEANFGNYEFNVEQLCKQVFMSHSQLHRKLEALTGCSPNRFIRIVRLNTAKELLANPALSIATVALECGYNDSGYFTRVFKQENGVTPQEWRNGKTHT